MVPGKNRIGDKQGKTMNTYMAFEYGYTLVLHYNHLQFSFGEYILFPRNTTLLKKKIIVIQLQLYAFSPHPSTPPQPNPLPLPPSSLILSMCPL